jgi:alpha-galactosidase
LNGATRFVCVLGIDDEVKKLDTSTHGICTYNILRDGVAAVKTGNIKATDATAVNIDLDVAGWKYITLQVLQGDQNWGDHADWANAYFEYDGKAPVTVTADEMANGELRMDCITHFYSLPGVRLMNKLKTNVSGATITVENLPEGLTYNAKRQLVEGVIGNEGIYYYTVKASDEEGNNLSQQIKLEVRRDLISPTPMMGWLSWNVFEGDVAADTVKAIADAFERYKLPDYGYRYICIDDLWQGTRAADGTPVWDSKHFPEGIKPVADYVHGKGLKFGIYSDAASNTCGGAFGSLGHETDDANAYARWGCDLLKYDYCGAPSDSAVAHQRYLTMSKALKATGRDFLFYICEWGALKPWFWASEAGGHQWRVSYDSRDTWNYSSNQGNLVGVVEGIEAIKNLSYYTGVNRFNDADMMMVGLHGKGKSSNYANNGKGMTQTEYRSQFSLWCMFSSPLTLSFDLRKIVDADLSIITNTEVIALDQDPMGQQAQIAQQKDSIDVYYKDLENGDIAVAVLNRGAYAKKVAVDMSILPLDNGVKYLVRDLWKHSYIDTTDISFTSIVLSHGTNVFRLSRYNGTNKITDAKNITLHSVVSPTDSGLHVRCKGFLGCNKRILVSDFSGRVLAGTQGSGNDFDLTLDRKGQICVVNIVCAGQSKSVKIAY